MYWASMLMFWLFVAAVMAVPMVCIVDKLRIPQGRSVIAAGVLVIVGVILLFVLPNGFRPLAAILLLPPAHLLVFFCVSAIFQQITGRRLELIPALFIKREHAKDFAFTQVAIVLSMVVSGLVIFAIRA